MLKNKIYLFLKKIIYPGYPFAYTQVLCACVLLLFIVGCGKINQDLKESGVTVLDTRNASASNNVVDKIVSIFENYKSSTPIVNIQFTNNVKKPLAELNTRKVVFNESSSENKEIIETDNEYDETGKILLRSYTRHEIPAKKDSKSSTMPIFSVLLASIPSWLILFGIMLIGLYKALKWVWREYKEWRKK